MATGGGRGLGLGLAVEPQERPALVPGGLHAAELR